MSAFFVFESNSEADTDRLGAALARALPPGAVVALVGTLGAGKTRLVQAVGKAVGLEPQNVVSPTFVLVHEYEVPIAAAPDPQVPVSFIYHFDAYRVKDSDEFLALGPDEYFADERAWSFIEWADRVATCLPREHLQIDIEVTGPASRRFSVEPLGALCQDITHMLRSYLPTVTDLNPDP